MSASTVVERPPSSGQLINATGLRLGTIFTEDKLGEAISSLLEVLADYGFREAAIDHALVRDRETQQVHINLAVTSGRRARIGALLLAGEGASLSAEEIRTITGLEEGFDFPARPHPTRDRALAGALSGAGLLAVRNPSPGGRVPGGRESDHVGGASPPRPRRLLSASRARA